MMANLFAHNPYVKLGSGQVTDGPGQPVRGALAQGQTWYVLKQDGRFVLDYFSGEHSGGSKRIIISPEKADNLVADHITVDDVLIAHGAS